MRVFAGHQLDNPEEAFFVFARSKQDAINFLATEDIEVDEASLKPVRDAGAVLFRAGAGAHPGEAEAIRFEGDLPRWSEHP